MSKSQYVRNDSSETVIFPTLDPPLQLDPGDVAGIPEDVSPPAGVVTARASDHKGPGSAPVHTHPADAEPTADDPWVGEPSPDLTGDDAEPDDEPDSEPDES